MTGGLGAVNNHNNNNNKHCIFIIVPASAVVTLIGSLAGPGNTVNADILQVYSVNGLRFWTVPVVLVTVI